MWETIDSSQVVIIDKDRNFYLEDNEKFDCISFYWWKIESHEFAEDAVIRELEEELKIHILKKELVFLEQESEELQHWDYFSTLFLLQIDDNTRQIIEQSSRLIKTTLDDFDWIDKKTMINRKNFKRKLLLALNKC
jgi:8-oxo-dGTP pyrophosphatase MutT (NUDIX family)